ncbi:STAS domain-containing protein [Streptomyces californicus]|uniref:STAS domain-containing protein n=1 Tax=Streptomyces californicus TaxID=67351 RepID=UPI0037B385AC
MRPLTLTTRVTVTGPVLRISGDLDYETAPELREAVDGLTLGAGQTMVLDLADLGFCDSSGISALISARNLAMERGGGVALAAVPPNTLRILSIVGLDQVFTLLPDAATATGPDLMTG